MVAFKREPDDRIYWNGEGPLPLENMSYGDFAWFCAELFSDEKIVYENLRLNKTRTLWRGGHNALITLDPRPQDNVLGSTIRGLEILAKEFARLDPQCEQILMTSKVTLPKEIEEVLNSETAVDVLFSQMRKAGGEPRQPMIDFLGGLNKQGVHYFTEGELRRLALSRTNVTERYFFTVEEPTPEEMIGKAKAQSQFKKAQTTDDTIPAEPKPDGRPIVPPLENDSSYGVDRLGIEVELSAIADAMALESMNPPLVVGILGGWGAGKSYAMHLIQKRLREISSVPLLQDKGGSGEGESLSDFPYVGHLYKVNFDAWTYAKANLWASLMQKILSDLDAQLQIEEVLKACKKELRDGYDVWRIFDSYSETQRSRILKELQATESSDEEVNNKAPIEEVLWSRLERSRHSAIEKLNTARNDLETLEKVFTEDLPALKESAAKKKFKADLGVSFAKNIRTAFLDDENDKSAFPDFADIKKTIPIFEMLKEPQFTLFFVASFLITVFIDKFPTEYFQLALPSGLLAYLAASWKGFQKATSWLQEQKTQYETKVKEARESISKFDTLKQGEHYQSLCQALDLDGKNPDLKTLEAQYKTLKERCTADVEEAKRLVGLTARAPSLKQFIKQKIGSGIYEEKLGLVHQVQKDLEELTDAFLPPKHLNDKQSQEELFPRGKPRVILFIDDLDRCPPDRVVEVLEAAQLLVKTRLFVVVLGMDVRYITRALEKEYKDILVRDGDPSGLDYIEKIVQIPYRVPPIHRDAFEDFIQSQIPDWDKNTDQESPETEMVIRSSPAEIDPAPDSPHEDNNNAGNEPASLPAAESKPALGGNTGLSFSLSVPGLFSSEKPKENPQSGLLVAEKLRQLSITKDEVEFIKHACASVGVSPRSGKRLVNVFKLLKFIWDATDMTPEKEVQTALLTLLALSAKYPEVMRDVLKHMELTFYKGGIEGDLKTHIETFLNQEGQRENPQVIHLLEALATATVLKEVDLDQFTERNMRLTASFSFVGEVGWDGSLAAPVAPTE